MWLTTLARSAFDGNRLAARCDASRAPKTSNVSLRLTAPDNSINPFAIPNPADEKKKKGLHEKLDGSAALLGPSALVPPNVLSISEPRRGDGMPTASAHLLTGTYLLPSGVPDTLPSSVLELALRADTITRLLDTVFRGIESCAAAFRDADKQTFLWRDELEICGQQQAVSAPDVHADLFRFLMTGRPSVPVSEWLGNRLTNRVRVGAYENWTDASLSPNGTRRCRRRF